MKPILSIALLFFFISIIGCKSANQDQQVDITNSTGEINPSNPTADEKSEQKEEDPTQDEAEVEKINEEPNTYMDPFDPDFITGKWVAEEQNGFSFDAWFYVEDGYVSGQYCAMNEDASRVDCGTQDEVDLCYLKSPYLVGKKILELEVVSCYAMKKGKATIEPHGDGNLKWTLTESPGKFGVDHFAPEEAIMYKKSFDPWD